jgi:nucleoid-associated protein YgaU
VFYDRLVAPPEPMAPLDLKDPPPAPPAPPTVPELTPEQRRALDVEKALADLRAQLPPAAVVEVKVRVDGGAVFLEGKVDTRGTLDQAARVTGGVAGVVAVDTRGLSIESRLHAVAQGETLSDIAKHYYGKSDAWPRIVKANPGLAPERMHAGQELRIPSSDE